MYLANVNPHETQQAVRVLDSLTRWGASLAPEDVRSAKYNDALDAVDRALIETRRYLRHRREGRPRDDAVEETLSQLWSNAASHIRPYDVQLAGLCMVKGHGWADPAVWDHPQYRELPLKLDEVLTHLRRTAMRPPPPPPVPAWFPIAGVAFTLLAVLSLFYLLVRPDAMPSDRRVIFNAWVALCVAASASFLGGTAHAQGHLPWLKDEPIKFVAAGGFAVFVITLILMQSINR